MSTVLEHSTFTTEQLLALPNDGVERWLIDGELREKPMTVRNRIHCEITAIVTYYLVQWSRAQSVPRGKVSNGEVGFRLSRNPDSTVGVDVAFAPPEVVQIESDDETTLYEGAPLLAVEVLSPNDTQQQVSEKVRKYLDAGTKLVWVIDPDYPTLTVHEVGKLPVLYNSQQQVSGEPYLPGLIMPIGELVK